jgi:hypothetical protein
LFGDADRFNDNLATLKSTFAGTISRNGGEISVDGIVDHCPSKPCPGLSAAAVGKVRDPAPQAALPSPAVRRAS